VKFSRCIFSVLLSSTTLCGFAGLLPTPALAANTETGAASGEFSLDEIVVSARRRDESLQDVPIAVSAFGQEQLERYQSDNLVELGGKAPSLFIKQNPTTTVSTSLYIRGVGQDESHFTSENGVGVYIDGVFYPRASGSLIELLDFDRVEILRGPQGTLFGKNSPAGAIALYSRRPDFAETSVRATFGVGRYNRIEGSVFANVPLSDNLAVKFDFGARTEDGYVFDNVSETTVNGVNKQALRVSLRWAPTEDTDVNLIFDKSRDRSEPFAPTFVVGRTPQYPLFESYIDPGFNRSQRFDGNGLNLTIDRNLSDQFAVKSITAYRWFNHDLWGELLGIPGVPIALSRDQKAHAFSQELQLNINFGNFNGVLGAIYFSENNKEKAFNQFSTGVNGNGNLYPVSDQDSESIAAFFEGTYRFTDYVSLTAGGRIGRDKKTMNRRSTNLPNGAGNVVAYDVQDLKESWAKFTPRVILDFHPLRALDSGSESDLLIYASYSRGYKAGAFDPAFTGNQAQAEFIYDPETVTAYEVGVKTEFFDRRLTVNAAFYYNDYQNFQIANCNFGPSSICVPTSFDVTLKGLEVEATARPVEGLTLFASLATINDKIDKSSSFANRDLENTPSLTYFLSGEYKFPVVNDYTLTLGGNWQWTDSYFHDLPNGREAETDAYGLLGAYVAVGEKDSQWELRLWAENLTNKTYIVNALSGGSWWLGKPRTWGVRASARF
jgi:iron complex outermembrane recepter protein